MSHIDSQITAVQTHQNHATVPDHASPHQTQVAMFSLAFEEERNVQFVMRLHTRFLSLKKMEASSH